MCRMCLVEVSGPRGFSPAAGVLPAASPRTGGPHRLGEGAEGPGGRARVPARQPPPRLPGLRQGRRVPAAGPDALARPGREPIRRGEAPLGEADRDRPARRPRPRALHPVRPLHPVRRRDRRRGADRLRLAAASEIEVAALPERARSTPTSPATPCRSARSGRSRPRPYRFKSRPWDLEQVETTCTTCAVGCRVAAQSSAGELVRFLGVDSDPVNQSWLCDKGRFGYEAITAPKRARLAARPARGGELVEVAWREALGRRLPAPTRLGRGGPSSIGVHRRRAPVQRGRLRLGEARQGRGRHRHGRRAARRRAARRDRARPAAGDDRRGRIGHARRPARGRPPRGAAGAVPPPARGGARPGRALVECSPVPTRAELARRRFVSRTCPARRLASPRR